MVWGLKWPMKQLKKYCSSGLMQLITNSINLRFTSLNYICTLFNASFQVSTRLCFYLLHTLETFVLSAQPKKLTRAHANISKVLTTGTALPLLLQRSESQHWKEHVPLACLQFFNFALASSHSALLEQTLAYSLDSTLKTLNSMESVPQRVVSRRTGNFLFLVVTVIKTCCTSTAVALASKRCKKIAGQLT